MTPYYADDFRRTLRPCRWCGTPTDPRELSGLGVCIPCDDDRCRTRLEEQTASENAS